MEIPRVRLLGVPVDAMDGAAAQEQLRRLLSGEGSPGQRPALVLAVNPEKVLTLRKDSELLSLFERASMLLPDGVGVSLALSLLHGVPCGRVTGVETLDTLLDLAAEAEAPVFVLGAREEVNREACGVIRRRHPGLAVGRACGYQDEEGWRSLPGRIQAQGTRLLVVALGSPRQERWMAEHAASTGAWVVQGVGGSLDVMTGRVQRAPAWMRRCGMEWLGRLLREPSRLRRQWRLPWFVLLAVTERVWQGARPWERRCQP